MLSTISYQLGLSNDAPGGASSPSRSIAFPQIAMVSVPRTAVTTATNNSQNTEASVPTGQSSGSASPAVPGNATPGWFANAQSSFVEHPVITGLALVGVAFVLAAVGRK